MNIEKIIEEVKELMERNRRKETIISISGTPKFGMSANCFHLKKFVKSRSNEDD